MHSSAAAEPSTASDPRPKASRSEPPAELIHGIGELTRARDEAERRVAFQAAVLSQIRDAVVGVDLDGRVLYLNEAAAKQYGADVETSVGQPLHVLYDYRWPLPRDERVALDMLARTGRWQGEVVQVKRTGEEICAELTVSHLRGDTGEIEGYLAVIRDVTARRRSEEHLREAKREAESANRAKSAFLANMSHELRTPLNAIVGYGDLLELGIPEKLPTTCLRHVERIQMGARHLRQLIDDILMLARAEAGREQVEMQTQCVRELLDEMAAIMEPEAQRKSLRFRACCRGVERVRTDPRKLRQILLNLLGNAVKFTQRGEVSLEVEADDEQLSLRVRDTGIGLVPEDRARVFEPFWQADLSHTRTTGGTGLGLAISRRLAELIGGEIRVESEPGHGSTFTLVLPADAVLVSVPPYAGPGGSDDGADPQEEEDEEDRRDHHEDREHDPRDAFGPS